MRSKAVLYLRVEPGSLKVGTLGIKSLVCMFCVCVGCGWGLRDATKLEGKILEPITREGNMNKNLLSKWLGRWYPVYKTFVCNHCFAVHRASLCCWKRGAVGGVAGFAAAVPHWYQGWSYGWLGSSLWAGSSDRGMTTCAPNHHTLLQRSSRKSDTESAEPVGIYQHFEKKPGVSGDDAPGKAGPIAPRTVPTPTRAQDGVWPPSAIK